MERISVFPETHPATHRGYIRVAARRITLILLKNFDIIYIQGKEIRKSDALDILNIRRK